MAQIRNQFRPQLRRPANTFTPKAPSPKTQGQTPDKKPVDGFERAGVRTRHGALDLVSSRKNDPLAALQSKFQSKFAQRAADKQGFHDLLRKSFGNGYDAAKAESFRQKALKGDFSWMPKVRTVDSQTLGGAHGAYDAKNNTIYLDSALLQNPTKGAEVLMEEVGHHLDAKLNRSDTRGDEGEMFRRLMGGEKLSKAQIREIRTENDKGTIKVDGREVEVEFWNPFKAIGKAFKKAGKAIGGAFKKAGKAIINVAKKVGKAIGGVAKKVGHAIGKAAKWVGDKVSKAAKWIGPRLWDGAKSLFNGVVNTVRGAAMNIWEGIKTFGSGFGKLFKGDFGGAFKAFGSGLLKTFVQTPVDAILMAGGKVISAVQTVVGLEPPGRDLSSAEITELKKVYGDSIDWDKVQIKEGNVGLFGVSGRPFTHGNTIYIPKDWLDKHPSASDRRELLVHEMAHVWQNQNGGTDYMSEAIIGQQQDGYNFAKGLNAGAGWHDLNPEQQAEMLEKAYAGGFFDNPNQRFLVRLTDPNSDHGFEVVVLPSGDAGIATREGQGFVDYTDMLNDSKARVLRGEGD